MQNYDDMINLPHPTSANHPRMSLYDRAAQFSPFAALTGYDEAVKETARLTEQERELDEDEKERLNRKLRILQQYMAEETARKAAEEEAEEMAERGTLVEVIYFEPDERKTGGRYVTYTGALKRIDVDGRKLIMEDKTVVPIERIRDIMTEMNGEMPEFSEYGERDMKESGC